MNHLGCVATRVKTKFFIDENGKAKRIGNPDVAQLRFMDSISKAAKEIPGLSNQQAQELAKNGVLDFVERGEHYHFELVTADEYDRQYNAEIAARDAK